jgi:hypothetical protein
MSEQSRKKACRKSQATADQCGSPTRQQIDAVLQRLIQDRTGWTLARCRQRAMVEVFLRGVA